jgi:hypothetical protein
MSLFNCIDAAVTAGEMEAGRGAEAQALVRELEARYAHLGPEAAAAQAAADAKKVLRQQTARKKRLMLKQALTAQRLAENVRAYVNLKGVGDAADALPALLEWDQAARFENVSQIRDALTGRYHRIIADFLATHGRGVTGQVRNRAGLDNIVRELFGQGTGDAAARETAQAVAAGFEAARTDFNAAGGNIGRLEDFGLPHAHDARRLRAAGFEAWRAAIEPALDWGRIRDHATELPFGAGGAARKTAFLQAIFEDIVSDGWARRDPGFGVQGRALANRRADHRVLHFAGADAWIAYNQAFGRADPFTTVVTQLSGLARDTALMRVLGPNPAAGLEFAIQVADQMARRRPWDVGRKLGPFGFNDAADKVGARAKLARNMLAFVTGAANEPYRERVASFMAGTRNVLTSARLGGAMLSAVSDLGFQAMAARHLGMGAGRIIARQARLLASSGERMAALRSGVIADELANAGGAMARFNGEAFGPEITERLAETTMRLSGLSRWTEAGRLAFQLEFFGFLADQAGKRWDELPDPLRRLFLEERGFDARQWDLIRSTPLHRDPSGATFLIPDDIRRRADLDPSEADGLALRLQGAIQEQMEFAVPSGSLRGRAILLGNAPPGSFAGELLRSGLMFKNFALSLAFGPLRRVFLAPVNGSRAGNIAGFLALTTLMGAASIQLKEVAKGRDPRDMTTSKFAAAAFAQGGGLGIVGDFAASSTNRFGGGAINTLVGPAFGVSAEAAGFTVQSLTAIRDGRDPRAGRRIVAGLRQNTPLASLWWANLVVQRLVFDSLQRALDPEAEGAFRAAERKRVREFGNPSFFPPGASAPARPPDLSNAFGGQP